MITEKIIEEYKKKHEEDVKRERRNLKSEDGIKRAHARSVVYGCHDPLLYAIKHEEFFNKEYSGIEYVRTTFEKYGYSLKEYYEDGILCIDVFKDNETRAKLTFSQVLNRVSMFRIVENYDLTEECK